MKKGRTKEKNEKKLKVENQKKKGRRKIEDEKINYKREKTEQMHQIEEKNNLILI